MSSNQFYDDYWKSGAHAGMKWSQQRFEKVLGPLTGRGAVLDYGCGVGHKYRRHLMDANDLYTGADVSEVALDTVREMGGTALKIDINTSGIEAEDASFDGAVCSEVFEHLFDPLRATREIFRVLKPGAPFVATVPNFGYHPWRIQALLRARVPDEPEDPVGNPFNGVHIRYFSAWTFGRMLEMAGFSDVRVDSYIRGSVWDLFRVLGPLSRITVVANRFLPDKLHFKFLSDLFPGLFAERIRAVCYKPTNAISGPQT
ncbi:MAG: methyltransferase domain-containing protein [Luteolibacter sp.]